MAGLKAENAESIEAVFVFGITTTTGLLGVILIGVLIVEVVVVDLLHAIIIETTKRKLKVLNPSLDLKI